MNHHRKKRPLAPESWWLFVLGERKGLEWVTTNSLMAFSRQMCSSASKIKLGDLAFIYQTKKLLGDVGKVTALVRVTSDVENERIGIEGGLNFACVCSLEFLATRSPNEGVALAPLVPELDFIRNKEQWPHYLRRGLVNPPGHDGQLLARRLGVSPRLIEGSA